MIGLALSALLFTWIARSGTLDFWIEQRFFDPVTHSFPLKNAPYLVFLGHTLLKDVTSLGLLVGIVLAVAGNWVDWLRPWLAAAAPEGGPRTCSPSLRSSSRSGC